MPRSALLWPWLVLPLVNLTSSNPTAVPPNHGTEFGLYEHNDTHSLLHVSSPTLGHHSDMFVSKDVADLVSKSVRMNSGPHIPPTDEEDVRSPATDRDDDQVSSEIPVNDAGPSSTASSGAEDTSSDATEGEENESSNDFTSITQSSDPMAQTETGAVSEDALATDEDESGSFAPSSSADVQQTSPATASSREGVASTVTHLTSPPPSAAVDGHSMTEMDSSTDSYSSAKEADTPLTSASDPSTAVSVTSPAILKVDASAHDPPSVDDDVDGGDEVDDGDAEDSSREPNPGLKAHTAAGKQTQDEEMEGIRTKTERTGDERTEDEDGEDEEEESEEEASSSEEEDGEAGGDVWKQPPMVNGTIREAGAAAADSGGSQRERNVTTFALVMCGLVGGTFVILVGFWINRIRRNERLRSLQEDEDEEFTVFSATDTGYSTTPGGRYAPLR